MQNAMLWENLREPQFPEAVEKSKGVCVVPIGAMEKHGPHLPVGTDNIIAERTAILAAELEPVVVFPTFGFGNVNSLQNTYGAICFSNKLILDIFTELCREIARSGFKKILLLSSHGGNVFLLPTLCNSTREQKLDYVVMYAKSYGTTPADLRKALIDRRCDFPYVTDEDIAFFETYFEKPMQEGHADLDELLLVHESRPETVDLSVMGDENGENRHRTDHLKKFGIYTGGGWFADFPDSYAGSYFECDNERLDKAYMQLRVEYIAKMYKAVKDDTEMLAINDEWNKSW